MVSINRGSGVTKNSGGRGGESSEEEEEEERSSRARARLTDGSDGILRGGKGHETVTARAPRFRVGHDLRMRNWPDGALKEVAQVLGSRGGGG